MELGSIIPIYQISFFVQIEHTRRWDLFLINSSVNQSREKQVSQPYWLVNWYFKQYRMMAQFGFWSILEGKKQHIEVSRFDIKNALSNVSAALFSSNLECITSWKPVFFVEKYNWLFSWISKLPSSCIFLLLWNRPTPHVMGWATI